MKPYSKSSPATRQHEGIDFAGLAQQIKHWSSELGFQQTGISDTRLEQDEARLLDWLAKSRHGEMEYMQRHGTVRSRPQSLLPGTVRIISVRMDYRAPQAHPPEQVLDDPLQAYLSRYALGRDYHKVIRSRLQKLAYRIEQVVGAFGYRAFTDSAPILEKALAQKAGLGWIGKHTSLINEQAGSWFFLGELFTDLPLPVDPGGEMHCGTCRSCIELCPTRAIVAPWQLDARRCISYLTIELRGSIPEELRPLIGNRIYGCDDCQLVCPWNRFSQHSDEADFGVRNQLDHIQLTRLFRWSEAEFLKNTEGSAIRRIGYECWLRNIAVALGNAPRNDEVIEALQEKAGHVSELVREHVGWALQQHGLCS